MGRLAAFATPEARSRYEEAYGGDAGRPPLVLLHTMSFSSTVWVRNIAALSQQYRVLAVDTIGDVNLSCSERTVKGRDDYVEWFTDVLAALDVSRTAIAGNSYGGGSRRTSRCSGPSSCRVSS